MTPTPRRRAAQLLLALAGAAALAAPGARAARTAGTASIADDQTGAAAASVRATAGGAELSGALGQLSTLIMESLAAGATVEAGYFSMLVSTPASAGVAQIHSSSLSFSWAAAAPSNPSGTLYRVQAATDTGYAGSVSSAEAYGFAVDAAGLKGNATYYSRLAASYMEGDDSGYSDFSASVTRPRAPAWGLAAEAAPSLLRLLWDPRADETGRLESSWGVLASTLPAALQAHAAAAYGRRIFVSGGVSGAATASVRSAEAQEDGNLGAWRDETPLPANRESHAMAAWAGKLYIAGGQDGSAKATVWWAPLASDGTVGSWSAAAPLPAARSKLGLAAWNGRLYAVGGDNGVASQSSVYYASVQGDGTLSAWTSGASLPAALSGLALTVSSGTLYACGGAGSGVSDQCYRSSLSGGAPGAWSAATALPVPLTRHALVAAGGRLHALGGSDGSSTRAESWSAEIAEDGTLGAWTLGPSLPSARYLLAAAARGGRVYALGGSDGSSPLEEIASSALSGTQYLVEAALDSGYTQGYSSSGWTFASEHDASGLIPATTYFARVRARGYSGETTAPLTLGEALTLAAPPAAASAAFPAVYASSISAQWAANGNPAGVEYRAQASTSADFGGAVLSGAWAAALSATVTGLSLNTSYYLRAQARNAALAESPYTTLGATFTLAAAPSGTAITASGPAGLSLEWSAAGNPAGTRFEAQVAGSSGFEAVLQSSVTLSTSAVFSGLTSASTFYARVRALNGAGVATAYDAAASTSTGVDATPPSAATGTFASQRGAAGSLLAQWVAPADNAGAGTLLAGASYFIQWSSAPSGEVAWSTASAQLIASTGPLAPGALSMAALTALPQRSTISLRVWIMDRAGNLSPPSAVFSAYSSPFSWQALEGGGGFDAGSAPSLAADAAGDLHAAYRGLTGSQELRYAKRTAGIWGAAQAVDPGTLASGGVLALDATGFPQILYRDDSTPRLKLARLLSGSWTVSVVETGNFQPGGLAVDAAGRARITYYDAAAGDLKYGAFDGTSWSTRTVAGTGSDAGRESALALDASQNPHVAFYDATSSGLFYASAAAAGSWAVESVDAVSAGTACVIALDAAERPHIAYGDQANLTVKYASRTAGGWLARAVDELSGGAGLRLGLALDGDGAPAVSYSDRTGRDLKFAAWSGAAFSTQTLDSQGGLGVESSLSLDASGGVQIAYRDETERALKAASWSGAGLPKPFGGSPRGRVQAPTSIFGAVASSTSVQWGWTDTAANERGFRLYGATSPAGPFALIAGTGTIAASAGTGGLRSHVETGLSPGTTYYRYAVAFGSGGFVASGLAAAAPFDTSDAVPPSLVDNQADDGRWRAGAVALYDVDAFDTGGAGLTRLQVKASTSPGGTGTDLVAYTDAVVNINADSYTADWPLPSAVFSAMMDGATNFVTVRALDANGNEAVLADAFAVLKDTTPPALTVNSALDLLPRTTAPAPLDIDAADLRSGLAAFQYSASTRAGTADAGIVPWTDIAALSGATDYLSNWSVAFSSLALDATNYISVRAWDAAGSTRTLADAAVVLRVSGGPSAAVLSPSAAYASALGTVSGTAAGPYGVQAVELAFQLSPPAGAYWSGASFNSATPVWFTASGTRTWTYGAAGIAFQDQTAYAAIARASDPGGNYSAVYATAAFTLDASTPAAGAASPATGSTPTALAAVSGTASDAGAGLSSVELGLLRLSDGLWWNFFSESWGSPQVSTTAAGTSSWSLALSEVLQSHLADQASYYLAVRASDLASPSNAGSFFAAGSSTFTFSDPAPPAAVTDLAGAPGATPGEIRLSWTAPGDDGGSGRILLGQFLIQYSTFAGASYSTASAQVVIATAAVAPGSARGRLLANLSAGVTYYLALWTQDDAGRWSSLSNAATAYATPNPASQIWGHVLQATGEGITAVRVDCWSAADALAATAYTVADGSGSFILSGLGNGPWKVQATWTANGIASSVWIDGVETGTVGVDFALQLSYNLATLTGSLDALSSGTSALSTGPMSAGRAASQRAVSSKARVELYQGSRQVGGVPVPASGRWRIPNLLPGRYSVRAYDGFDYTDFQTVDLLEGQTYEVLFAVDPLPKDRVFAFPNPARTSATIRFESPLSPLEAQVLVFDIAGNLVKEIPGSALTSPASGVYHAAWDLTTNSGAAAASGVYLFSVKVRGGADQAGRVMKKLAVIR